MLRFDNVVLNEDYYYYLPTLVNKDVYIYSVYTVAMTSTTIGQWGEAAGSANTWVRQRLSSVKT